MVVVVMVMVVMMMMMMMMMKWKVRRSSGVGVLKYWFLGLTHSITNHRYRSSDGGGGGGGGGGDDDDDDDDDDDEVERPTVLLGRGVEVLVPGVHTQHK